MSQQLQTPVAIEATKAPLRSRATTYPEPFASRMARREKRPLGDLFGLTNLGINLTRLLPAGESALLHRHTKQDEFVYIIERSSPMKLRFCFLRACAPAFLPTARAHHLINRPRVRFSILRSGTERPVTRMPSGLELSRLLQFPQQSEAQCEMGPRHCGPSRYCALDPVPELAGLVACCPERHRAKATHHPVTDDAFAM